MRATRFSNSRILSWPVNLAQNAYVERYGYSHRDIVSGAGHDACYISRIAPTAIIFVPCENCVSHNEAENALRADLGSGCQVLRLKYWGK